MRKYRRKKREVGNLSEEAVKTEKEKEEGRKEMGKERKKELRKEIDELSKWMMIEELRRKQKERKKMEGRGGKNEEAHKEGRKEGRKNWWMKN